MPAEINIKILVHSESCRLEVETPMIPNARRLTDPEFQAVTSFVSGCLHAALQLMPPKEPTP